MTLNYSKPHYTKADKIIEVLNDLSKINSDRVACYSNALEYPAIASTSLKEDFMQIIKDGRNYFQQLVQTIGQIDNHVKPDTIITGKIYRAWKDLKVTLSNTSQKTLIASFKYNEEIALHAYKAAINLNVVTNADIQQQIEEQEEALRTIYYRMLKYREVRNFSGSASIYFN